MVTKKPIKKPARKSTKEKPICCPAMRLALSRSGNAGLSREVMANFTTGKCSLVLVYRLPKATRGDKSEHAKAAWIDVAFCPFCGKRIPKSDRLTVDEVTP